jgi:hypothetical protein
MTMQCEASLDQSRLFLAAGRVSICRLLVMAAAAIGAEVWPAAIVWQPQFNGRAVPAWPRDALWKASFEMLE